MRDSKKSERVIKFLTSETGDPVTGCQALPEYLCECLKAWPSWWANARGGIARVRGRVEAPEPHPGRRLRLKCFLVLAGTNQLQLDGGSLHIGAGDMGVIVEGWPNEEHWVADGKGRYLHLFIGVLPGRLSVNLAGSGGGFGLRDRDHAIHQGASISFPESPLLAGILEYQAVHQLGDAAWSRVIREVLLRGLLKRGGTSHSPLILRCQSIIDGAATDPELSVKSIAARLKCHPDYLSRRYIEETGSGLMEAVRAIRLQVARDFLEGSWLSIAEVAALSGWKDHSYFSLVFRKTYGCSPIQHRQRHRWSG